MVAEACTRLAIDRSDYRFSRRDVRHYTDWTDFQVKTHMHKLEALEYVLVHRGGRGQSFVYELLYDGQGHDGRPFLMGLCDPDALPHDYDRNQEHLPSNLEHRDAEKEPPRSIQGAPKEAPSSRSENALNTMNDTALRDSGAERPDHARPRAADTASVS